MDTFDTLEAFGGFERACAALVPGGAPRRQWWTDAGFSCVADTMIVHDRGAWDARAAAVLRAYLPGSTVAFAETDAAWRRAAEAALGRGGGWIRLTGLTGSTGSAGSAGNGALATVPERLRRRVSVPRKV